MPRLVTPVLRVASCWVAVDPAGPRHGHGQYIRLPVTGTSVFGASPEVRRMPTYQRVPGIEFDIRGGKQASHNDRAARADQLNTPDLKHQNHENFNSKGLVKEGKRGNTRVALQWVALVNVEP